MSCMPSLETRDKVLWWTTLHWFIYSYDNKKEDVGHAFRKIKGKNYTGPLIVMASIWAI